MKKWTALLLSATLTLSLAACGSTNQPTSTTPAASAASHTASQSEAQPKTGKTLVVYYSASGNTQGRSLS